MDVDVLTHEENEMWREGGDEVDEVFLREGRRGNLLATSARPTPPTPSYERRIISEINLDGSGGEDSRENKKMKKKRREARLTPMERKAENMLSALGSVCRTACPGNEKAEGQRGSCNDLSHRTR